MHTLLLIAIPLFAILVIVAVLAAASRRDRDRATGGLSRETRRRDKGEPATLAEEEEKPLTGREVERAAALERREPAPELVPVAPSQPPALRQPMDEEALGVTRRQFLNRGMLSLFGVSLASFGAASLAFLWPSGTGGFGSKITLPDPLNVILAHYNTTKEPYYYAPGRVYVNPYPAAALPKAKVVYKDSPAVLNGMEHGMVALYQKCVHLGCRVPWCKTSQWFECPCHGSKYNRVGEKKGGPAPRGLDRFGVAIAGQSVTIDTSLVVQGPPIGTNTTGQEAEGPHCVSVGE